MKSDSIKESDARLILANDCADVVTTAMESAGKLIEQVYKRANGDYKALFLSARAIVNAYVMQLTYTKQG